MASTEPCVQTSLFIQGLKLQAHLGWSAQERSVPQGVRFDVELYFSQIPQGCTSDSLSDTICYATLSDKLRALCTQKEYRLIEKLGWDAYQTIRQDLSPSIGLKIRAIKEKPPIDELSGGAVFTVSDWRT